jgi:hypothetical protein
MIWNTTGKQDTFLGTEEYNWTIPGTDEHRPLIFIGYTWYYIHRLTDECMVGPDECQKFIPRLFPPRHAPQCPSRPHFSFCPSAAFPALSPPPPLRHRRHVQSLLSPPVATARRRPRPHGVSTGSRRHRQCPPCRATFAPTPRPRRPTSASAALKPASSTTNTDRWAFVPSRPSPLGAALGRLIPSPLEVPPPALPVSAAPTRCHPRSAPPVARPWGPTSPANLEVP